MAVINYSLQTVLGTAGELAALNPVLLDGQLGKEVDTNKFKIGNGVLGWNSIEYHITNNTLSVFLGASIEQHNLLSHSSEDGGLVLPKEILNTESVIDGVFNGTLSLADRVAFALNDQHKLATLLLGVYVKRLSTALGGTFTDLLTSGGYSGNSVTTQLAALQTAISNLTATTTNLIDDVGAVVATKTWSSEKIASEILTAVQGLRNQLVGDAGEALDTIYELSEALLNNSGYITTLLDEVSKSVKFTEQTLTLGQQLQSRTNIAAASAALVGNYSEIGDVTLLSLLGNVPGDPNSDPVSLAELIDTMASIQLKTHLNDCSIVKSGFQPTTNVYTTTTWRRMDNSVAGVSTLTNEVAKGLFTVRTEVLYAGDGTTPIRTTVYNLTYDDYRNVLSEVISSVT